MSNSISKETKRLMSIAFKAGADSEFKRHNDPYFLISNYVNFKSWFDSKYKKKKQI